MKEWLAKNPHVRFHFTFVGSSWINQIETRLGIIARQPIRRSTFSDVHVLIEALGMTAKCWEIKKNDKIASGLRRDGLRFSWQVS